MARALLVGCGCRGREAGRILLDAGWAVRGTSRRPEALSEIEAAGIEAAEADPDRVGSVVELCADVSVVVWALGSAHGPDEGVDALHGHRLDSTLAKLVDTPVRGFVYEAAGTTGPDLLAAGADLVEAASTRWRIPVRIVGRDRGEGAVSADAISAAVIDVLRAGPNGY